MIGTGYLGATHAAAMAELGHDVIGVDIDQTKIDRLAVGQVPFYEPNLPEMLTKHVNSGRLRFTTSISEAAAEAELHFVCVGTPQRPGEFAADLTYVDAAFSALAAQVRPGAVVVGKSTVPVGTASRLARTLDDAQAHLVWNPEFLREGFAVADTLRPDRIVMGARSTDPTDPGRRMLGEAYATILATDVPVVHTDFATAELVKVAANAFLATKISFINAMAEIAEVTGADVTQLADAIGHDARIGRRFLGAGIGFGGGCLPKDIRAFSARAEELGRGESVAFLREIDAINLRRRDRAVDLVSTALGGALFKKNITVLGAAFKPHSDDIRDSPALDVAVRLHGLGADVTLTDPAAIENAQRIHPQLTYVHDRDEALQDADAVIVVTEWDEYRHQLDPAHAATLTRGHIVIDGRNCLDASAWRAAGWTYHGMGRP